MSERTFKQDGRPSLQWYPKDVLTDFGFMACSLAAQGLWYRMLWIMFFSDERGKLKSNGKQVDNKQLAKIIWGEEGGNDTTVIDILLKELGENGVYSKDRTGTIYCRRMLSESEKEKALSVARSEAGKLGGRPPKESKSKPHQNQSQSKTQSKKAPSSSIASPSSIALLKDNNFQSIWSDWLEVRKKLKAPNTERALELALNKLHKHPLETAIKMVEQSVERGWRGIFPVKENANQGVNIDEQVAKDKAKIKKWQDEAKADPVKPGQIKKLNKLIPKIGKSVPDK